VIQDQTRQALTNCEAILRAGGAGLDDVIEVGILLTHPADFAGLNEEYARWFPSEAPTRYVAKLGVDLPGLPGRRLAIEAALQLGSAH
jgi:2-iminobutanoate/2-iminopropanoate deaminase